MLTEFKAVDHHPEKKRSKPLYVAKESQFMSDVEKLFDMFCEYNQRRRELEKKCRLRITQDDFMFYEDQKGPRKARCLRLEELLTSSNLRFRRRIDEKGGDQPLSPSHCGSGDASSTGDPIVLDNQSLLSDIEDSCSQSLESSYVSFSGVSQLSLQNRMNFPNLARITERPNQAAAALANAVSTAVGLITERQKKFVIDKSKLRRERQTYREQICQDQAIFCGQVNGAYVDGRKDATLTTCLESGKIYQLTCLEKHIIMVGEPGE